MTARITLVALAALLLFAPATRAGDPNPPPGPVVPTMQTLQEIWIAISTNAGSVLADDRQGAPWIASSRGTVYLSIPEVSGPDTTPDGITDAIRLIEFEESITRPGGGQAEHQLFTFIKEIDQTTPSFKEFATSGINVNPTFRFYDSEDPGTPHNLRINLATAYTTGTKTLGIPAAGEQRHLEIITMVFEQVSYQWFKPPAAASLTPPPGPVASTMHTLDEINTAVTMALPLDDRSVGADFIAQPRLEAYLELPAIIGPDETPDRIRDVIKLLEFCDPLTLQVSIGSSAGETQIGQPMFDGLRVTMELGETTIDFRSALFAGTNLGVARMHVYKLDSTRVPVEYFRITLTGAVVFEMNSTRRAHGRALRHPEEVVLHFQTIEWDFFQEFGGQVHWGWDVLTNQPL